MSGPFVWVARDCCTASCDAFAALHGVDPMAALRAAYTGPREARQIIAAHGGLHGLASTMAARSGLRPGVGGAGEIGVTPADEKGRASLVISTGDGWLGKGMDGMAMVREVAACWRV